MPKFPEFSFRLNELSGSVFEKFLPKMREKGDALVKLHIGDSYLPPPYALPLAKDFLQQHPTFNRYCNTFGVAELRRVIAEKVSADNGIDATPDNIMMTAGASNALVVTMLSLVNPGEEVLVLTPCWPFFPGMVKLAGGVVKEVPCYNRLYDNPDLSLAALLKAHLTDRTVAVYLNSPNNPSGKVLNRSQLQEIADFVKTNRLWLVSDEAYDGMTYDEHQHISIAGLPGMRAQTISIFTFSKVFMFAGLRLGYIAAEAHHLRQMNKALVHLLYSPSTFGQQMMVQPVQNRHEWSGKFIRDCRETRNRFSEMLQIPHHLPEGAYYLFFDIAPYLQGRDYWQVIEDLLDAGVSVAPGKDFGNGFETFIRLCYAGEPPERILTAAERINKVLLP